MVEVQTPTSAQDSDVCVPLTDENRIFISQSKFITE